MPNLPAKVTVIYHARFLCQTYLRKSQSFITQGFYTKLTCVSQSFITQGFYAKLTCVSQSFITSRFLCQTYLRKSVIYHSCLYAKLTCISHSHLSRKVSMPNFPE